jgi:hypothetical protein
MAPPAGGWARVVNVLLQGGAALAALSGAQAQRRLLALGVAAVALTVAVAALASSGSRWLGGAARRCSSWASWADAAGRPDRLSPEPEGAARRTPGATSSRALRGSGRCRL